MGKVYLYEKKNALAAQQLAEVNGPTPGGTSTFGYKLLSSNGDLWTPLNKFNTESILEETHSAGGNSTWDFWGSGRDEGNTVNVQVGSRSYERKDASAPDLPSGWSFMVFTQDFFDFIKNDPPQGCYVVRFERIENCRKGGIHCRFHEHRLVSLTKFLPRKTDVTKGAGIADLNYRQNTYLIRLADTYLMEAEALGGAGPCAQALLDAVRARVGLALVAVSMDAIKTERRAELAGEATSLVRPRKMGRCTNCIKSRGFIPGTGQKFSRYHSGKHRVRRSDRIRIIIDKNKTCQERLTNCNGKLKWRTLQVFKIYQ